VSVACRKWKMEDGRWTGLVDDLSVSTSPCLSLLS
jgi:hypothetical protein